MRSKQSTPAAAAPPPVCQAASTPTAVLAAQHPSFDDIMAAYDPSSNQTPRDMTKFELAQVVGMRMEQLVRNAPAFVDVDDILALKVPLNEKLMHIALRELAQRKMPFMICRPLPGGAKEYWRLCDMVVPNILPMSMG